MKIKKVEIEGFRAFKKVENSTFDFTLPGDKIANFISIYAPNGYGKTSFYDAIEWGVTHQIQRFDRMTDFKKIKKDNKLQGKKDILLNNESTKGSVKVETNISDFHQVINNRKEYDNSGVPTNAYFKDVILSQELIDSFIKEEKADERYTKFIESNREISTYNTSLKNLTKLIEYLDTTSKSISDDIKNLMNNQLVIDFEGEIKKFDEINTAIKSLIAFNENIQTLQKETFTETQLELLTQKIKFRTIFLAAEIEQAKNLSVNLDYDYNGNSGRIGVVEYFKSIEEFKRLESQKIGLTHIYNLFTMKDNYEVSSQSLRNLLQNELDLEKTYALLNEAMKTYIVVNKEIANQHKILSNYEKEEMENGKTTQLLRDSNTLKSSELLIIQERLKTFKIQNQNLKDLTEKAKTFFEKRNALLEQIKSLEDLESIIRERSERQSYFIDKIENDVELLIDIKEFKNNKKVIELIISTEQNIESLNKEIAVLTDKINIGNGLNSEFKELVSQALKMITPIDTDCPVCNSHFTSYEELSQSIIKNQGIDKFTQTNISEKLLLEDSLSKSQLRLNENREILRKVIKKVFAPFKDDQASLNKLESLRKDRISNDEEKFKILNDFRSVFLTLGINQNFDSFEKLDELNAFETTIVDTLKELENTINEISKELSENTKKIETSVAQQASAIANKNIILGSISKLRSIKEYAHVVSFYKTEFNTNNIKESILTEHIQTNAAAIKDLQQKIKTNLILISEIEMQLSGKEKSKDVVQNKIGIVNNSISVLDKAIQNFENHISSQYRINLKKISRAKFDHDFNNLKRKNKEHLQLLENILKYYKIVDGLKDDCLRATESEKIQTKIEELKNEKSKLSGVQLKLKKERENLINYLKETINGFFYKDLINSIYRKIDPHPEYSEIEFECNFEESKPRLQIYTIKQVNGKPYKSVPALYFSTAQINILSLSIFLARALKARNPDDNGNSIDCIFIDDPIQSMDSINILSFIDLFRSLILTQGKQLIVSTHEENFHLLLQKKIPNNLFDSKFLEFETFGKLKA